MAKGAKSTPAQKKEQQVNMKQMVMVLVKGKKKVMMTREQADSL